MMLVIFSRCAFAEPLSIPQTCAVLQITPESLTASGVSTNEANALAGAFALLTDEREELRQRLDATQSTLRLLVEAQAATMAGQMSEADLHLIEAQSASAQAALDDAVEALWDVVTDQLSSQVRLRLSAWQSNAATRLPAEFRTIAWSHQERARLERALVAERRALVTGRALDAESVQLLALARSRVEVSEAATWLQTRLPDIRQALAGSSDAQ